MLCPAAVFAMPAVNLLKWQILQFFQRLEHLVFAAAIKVSSSNALFEQNVARKKLLLNQKAGAALAMAWTVKIFYVLSVNIHLSVPFKKNKV